MRNSNPSGSHFWRRTIFTLALAGCSAFVVLTTVAMFFYAGGTVLDPQRAGYSFTNNFFSDLGLTITRSGQPNTISALLFTAGLTLAGVALAAFFVAFTQFFTRPRWIQALSLLGALFGVIAGGCFVGVAFTPADLNRQLHGQFVLWAFQAFLVAVICFVPPILVGRTLPRRYAWPFIAFAALLGGYLWLLMRGPSPRSAQGLPIQVIGQKVIAYASVISVLIQAWGARRAVNSV